MTRPEPAASPTWDPHQYLRFTDHRLRPALELLDRIPLAAPATIYDLGCGPGNVTQLIAQRWPEAAVYGVDNSPAMLAQATKLPGSVQWVEADIRTWTPAHAPDLLFSNATLQWLDGHQELFPRLLSLLPAGGCLAVQMPLSFVQPSHQAIRETLAHGGPNGAALGSDAVRREANRNWVSPTAIYYELLSGRATSLDIWETEYLQVLQGEDPVLEWVTGTTLRPILEGLSAVEQEHFREGLRRRLREAYPLQSNGVTLYPFRRLFMVAIT